MLWGHKLGQLRRPLTTGAREGLPEEATCEATCWVRIRDTPPHSGIKAYCAIFFSPELALFLLL